MLELFKHKPPTNLKHFNWGPTETLKRDKEQSRRLHEPTFRIMTTDPISGKDVDDYENQCSLTDGNLTIYFESKENCNEFERIPLDHPIEHLPIAPTPEDDRSG